MTNFNGLDGYMIPFPNYHILGPNIKGFAEAGATNYYPEGETESNGGEMAALKTYIISKLLWDPAANATALTTEFLDGYYGKAAGAMQEYIDAFTDAAAPSSAGERRFAKQACVEVGDRPWAKGGRGFVTMAHPDGTYEVNMTSLGAPSHPDVVSWVYLQHCDQAHSGMNHTLLVDMMAESCGVMQNGSHVGWACGYLTPMATMRGLRAQLAAANTPHLTPEQSTRVLRSSLPIRYIALVKWEELRAWVDAHPTEGGWPLPAQKEAAFKSFIGHLEAFGITTLGEGQTWTEAGLRDRIFFGNATAARVRRLRRRPAGLPAS